MCVCNCLTNNFSRFIQDYPLAEPLVGIYDFGSILWLKLTNNAITLTPPHIAVLMWPGVFPDLVS